MAGMTEANPISTSLLGSAHQTSGLMTGAARRDVLSVSLGSGRVTAKTGDVSIQSRGNREPNAATISPVTRGASSAGMFGVIEPRIETAQRGKGFHLPTLSVCVTDRADLARLICELLGVTAGAGCMCSFARQRRLRRIVFATMAKQTGKPRVITIVVFEP